MTAWDDLSGRRALVTGAAQGIGAGIAAALRAAGARVTGLDRRAGPDCIGCDLADPGQIGPAVDRAAERLGGIDILVNNAAYQMTFEELTEIPDEEWDKTFRTNIHAMFYLTKAAVPHMKEGGAIINTTSVNADMPKQTLLPYATTKGAIQNFTGGLAQMLAERKIRVNCVAPGPVWTPLIPSTMPPDQVKEFGASYPIGRPAQPKELAPAYVMLATDEASYVSGATIAVTGGKPFI